MESRNEPEEHGETGGSNQAKGKVSGSYKKLIIVFIIVIIAIPAGLFIKEMINRSNPEYYLRFQDQGVEYFKAGNLEKAAKEFKRAVKYGPDKFDTHFGLGQTYLMMNNFNGAIVELEKAIKVNPKNLNAIYSLGVAYQQTGKFEEAMKAYYVVGKNLPKSSQVYYNMAIIQLKSGSLDKAILGFKEAIELKKDFYPAYIALGQTYATKGNKALARKEYQLVKELAAKDPNAVIFVDEAEKRLAELGQ